MKNIFDKEVSDEFISRINNLNSESEKLWGTMDSAQMLAHCNVTYEMIYEDKHPKAKGFKKILLKLLVKPIVTNNKPYKKNSPTAPQFKMKSAKNFEEEKNRLVSFVKKTQELGPNFFENKESNSFGKLKSKEWNAMFYKHLDHHLNQFGV